jgi:ABC-type antimicrobial peptide transport system permease subunit
MQRRFSPCGALSGRAPFDQTRRRSCVRSLAKERAFTLVVMEPLIYVLVSTIAVVVALLAGLPAARRATSVQPMVAIRSE